LSNVGSKIGHASFSSLADANSILLERLEIVGENQTLTGKDLILTHESLILTHESLTLDFTPKVVPMYLLDKGG